MKYKVYIICCLLAVSWFAFAGVEVNTLNICYLDSNGKNAEKQVPVIVPKPILPEKVIDPQTYQDTTTSIRYVNTAQLIQRGFQILEYAPQSKTNAAGYQPYYSPSLHANVYMRIPSKGNVGEALYPGRW